MSLIIFDSQRNAISLEPRPANMPHLPVLLDEAVKVAQEILPETKFPHSYVAWEAAGRADRRALKGGEPLTVIGIGVSGALLRDDEGNFIEADYCFLEAR